MFSSLRIGRIFGIDTYIHPTFWLLPLLVILGSWSVSTTAEISFQLAVLFTIFGCVLLHELGHSLAAKAYGFKTRDITLLPIGGVARFEKMPEKPIQEIVVALAGPAVNLVIVVGIVAMMVLDGFSPDGFSDESVLTQFWGQIAGANLILLVFNLLPAFPMDGGRVLRALLSYVTDRITATEVASIVGGVFAVLIALYGFNEGNYFLPVLALFVFLAGRAELYALRAEAYRKTIEERWGDRVPLAFTDWEIPVARRATTSHPDGWEFDAVRRIWTQYRHGEPVRRIVAE